MFEQETGMTAETKQKRRNSGPCGPLYDLLVQKLPDYHLIYGGHIRLDIYKLSEAIGVSPQHIYQVLPSGDKPAAAKNLSVRLARKLIQCSEEHKTIEPLTLLDLEPFLPS